MRTRPRSQKRSTRSGSLWMLLLLALTLAACGDEAPDPTAGGQEPAAALSSSPTDSSAALAPTQDAKLNLNTASREEFLVIPEVNDRMTREFDEYRPYVSIRQFRQEIGKYVSEEQVASYEQYVYVPVDPGESDAETLRQLPGVDAEEADALVADRPYATREAFLEALSAYVTEEELAAAEPYLKAP